MNVSERKVRFLDRSEIVKNYESFFRRQLSNLRREGRYRIFADLERRVGDFPRAIHYRDRDQALDRCGAGAPR
jgi:hypothetical protein